MINRCSLFSMKALDYENHSQMAQNFMQTPKDEQTVKGKALQKLSSTNEKKNVDTKPRSGKKDFKIPTQ